MTSQESKKFTDDIFNKIKKAKTISDVESIPDEFEISEKNRMKVESYPKIEFSINQNEIQTLIDYKIIDNNLKFSTDITSKLTDPLTKLFYATAWKNGDLDKIRHIINGILDNNPDIKEQEDALVFYQFGKYLTKTQGQPIIDQHVIRAFAVYKSTDIDNVQKLQKLKTLNKTHKSLINDYINWLKGDELTLEIRKIKDYSYHIDKILFATGKTIKFKKHGEKKNTGANSGLPQ